MSNAIFELLNTGIFFDISSILLISSCVNPVVAITIGVFVFSAYSKILNVATGTEKSIITSTSSFILLFSEVNPIPVKYALNLMGYNYGKPRLPLVELSAKNQERMKCAMKNHNLI